MLRRRKWVTGFGVIAVVAILASLTTAGAGAQQQSAFALPRNATLYTSGTAWGPFAQFNPLRSSGNATGTLGLLYETLFRYDPLKDKYIPWLATDGKWVGRTYVLHAAAGREVERRQAAHRRGREVHVRDRQARGLGALDDVEDRSLEHRGEGQHRELRLHGQAELPRLEHEHLLVRNRAAAPLEELQRDRDHDRQHRQVHGRNGPVHVWRRQGNVRHAAVEPAQQLVGDESARAEDADAVSGRHPQHPEHRIAAELPQGRHRHEQQLLPGGRQGARREGADVLPEGAVHAVGQHRLAGAEHDTRTAQRQGVPAGTRDVDQRRPDRPGRLRQHRCEGEPDGLASHLEQVDRQGPGDEARLQVQHRGSESTACRERLQGHER